MTTKPKAITAEVKFDPSELPPNADRATIEGTVDMHMRAVRDDLIAQAAEYLGNEQTEHAKAEAAKAEKERKDAEKAAEEEENERTTKAGAKK